VDVDTANDNGTECLNKARVPPPVHRCRLWHAAVKVTPLAKQSTAVADSWPASKEVQKAVRVIQKARAAPEADIHAVTSRAGRKRITTRAELEHVALDLFSRQGFDQTTIDDIAAAARIGRRTFFRYFPSKNDVPWGDFDTELERMQARLKACSRQTPLMDAIRVAIVDFNRLAPEQIPWHRRRMELILRTPTLQAHSTLRYNAWRQVIAEFVGDWTGQPPDTLGPRTIAYAALGVAVAAYEQWLETDNADLGYLLDRGMRELAAAFAKDLATPASG
jgi:mycofactocin system transcriptional regulator